MTESNFYNKKCICCSKELKSVFESFESSDMMLGGTSDTLDCNYGSAFDGDRIVLAICDECIDKKIKEGIILKIKKNEHLQTKSREY